MTIADRIRIKALRLMSYSRYLSQWEYDFIHSLWSQEYPATSRQVDKLREIFNRIRHKIKVNLTYNKGW